MSDADAEQLWELLFTEHLFGNRDERYALSSMLKYLGPPPRSFLDCCERSGKFFDEKGLCLFRI